MREDLCFNRSMLTLTAAQLIEHFQMPPHPEGGYYRETYRSPLTVTPHGGGFDGDRLASTAIYFLLPAGSRSGFHRIRSDEAWHFYGGGPMTLIQLSPEGRLEEITLGTDLLRGHKVQHVVPAGYWFGGMPQTGTEYSFVGCTVAPGFEFRDFELAERGALTRMFPAHEKWIKQLT